LAATGKALQELDSEHLSGLLLAIERDSHITQRKLASELNVALGLVNAYLKRCVNKGLIKIQQVPRRRYAYYLTPTGFAEKSRLTAQFLASSLSFFRQARQDCGAVIAEAHRRGWQSIGLAGAGDLAEITILCANETGVHIEAIVDEAAQQTTQAGVRVVGAPGDLANKCPKYWVITAIADAQAVCDRIADEFGAENVIAQTLLRLSLGAGRDPASCATGGSQLSPGMRFSRNPIENSAPRSNCGVRDSRSFCRRSQKLGGTRARSDMVPRHCFPVIYSCRSGQTRAGAR
jgi:DNA-binding MarR family transcriptional regulator